MLVAAEGVVNEAQASLLRNIGRDERQGCRFSRPSPG
jgi:EAL domain-containing protein (putative c-di-GMP-specific phosphodiesterase class I)